MEESECSQHSNYDSAVRDHRNQVVLDETANFLSEAYNVSTSIFDIDNLVDFPDDLILQAQEAQMSG